MPRKSCQYTSAEWALLTVVLVALFLRGGMLALDNGADFSVFWDAGRTFLGYPPAADAHARGFVFKYPPWVIPFFLPWAALPWTAANALWFLTSFACLLVILRDLYARAKVRPSKLALTLLGFWWILLGHLSMGQVTLLLGAALTRLSTHSAISAYFQSFKVFTFATVLPKLSSARKVAIFCLGICVAMAAVLSFRNQSSFTGEWTGLFTQWISASTSGATGLGTETVRGTANHGLNVLILRALEWISARSFLEWGTWPEILIFIALIGGAWPFFRNSPNSWLWPAWVTLALPLTWHHSFALVFPLCAIALARESQSAFEKLYPWIAMICIGLIIPQTIGNSPVLRALELGGIKAWGALLLIFGELAHAKTKPAEVP